MKIKNKGKVYPSPSSSSSSSSSSDDRHVHSVLKLLPAAILALASVLSIDDREVLAYMITRSMDSSSVTTKKKPSRNKPFPHKTNSHTHKHNNPPLFDCDCFGCYTSYWFRWDSSPCREQIHQAIDAFEDYLANGGKVNKKNNARGKKKDASAIAIARPLAIATPNDEQNLAIITGDNEAPPSISPDNADVDAQQQMEKEKAEVDAAAASSAAVEKESLTLPTSAVSNDRGLARKMLPDVLGILNSRLWNLWSPNV